MARQILSEDYRVVRLDGVLQLKLRCPSCCQWTYLDPGHVFKPSGSIEPSLVCDCGFHDFVSCEGGEAVYRTLHEEAADGKDW